MATELQLLRFSPDVIGGIAAYLNPLEILHLFMCGNRQLVYALGPAGGLKTLNISVPPWMDTPWLSVISLFTKLHHFTIWLEPNPHNYILESMDLPLVSRELRTLSLGFLNVFNLLQSPPTSLEMCIPRTELAKCRYFDLASQFPVLESLTLSGSSRFSANIFDVLPPHLRSLYIRGPAYEDVTASVINKLPTSLTKFVLFDDDDSPSSGSLPNVDLTFPPELSELDLHTKWMRKVLPYLPASLATLALRWTYLSIEEFLVLPVSLTSLSAASMRFGTPEAQALPRELKHLVLSNTQRTGPPPVEFFTALPRDLANYRVNLQGVPPSSFSSIPPRTMAIEDPEATPRDPSDLRLFPPHLTTFACKYALTDEHIAALPRTVTSLSAVFSPESFIQAVSWPPKLSTLRDDRKSIGPAPSPMFSGPLPQSLTDLSINWGCAIANDNTTFLAKLPNLTKLNLLLSIADVAKQDVIMEKARSSHAPLVPSKGDIGSEFRTLLASLPPASASLPTSLRTLEAVRIPPVWQKDLRHLTQLSTLEITELKISTDSLLPLPEVTPATLSALPPQLTSLMLSTHTSTFGADCLKALPQQLRSLHIRALSSISCPLKNEDLRFMPRTLLSVIIPRTPALTSQALVFLPRCNSFFCHGQIAMHETDPIRAKALHKGLFGEDEE